MSFRIAIDYEGQKIGILFLILDEDVPHLVLINDVVFCKADEPIACRFVAPIGVGDAFRQCIHIADVHLFATPDAEFEWGENRPKEIEETFEKVIDACNEKDIDLLLIAGNLFDRSPSVEDLIFVDEKLTRLEKTRTVILSGSDDYIEPGSESATYKFRSRTVMLPADKTTNAYLRGINTCVTGYSYGKPEYREHILENIDPGREDAINILLGHGGDKNHMPFKKEKLASKGFDYVAMGYIRRPVHILKNRMAYAGSPEPLGPKETGRHGYVLGEINDSGTKITWCPI